MAVYDMGEEDRYRILASLALPEPAVIIDVREGEAKDSDLFGYLTVDLEELTMEMRLQEVPRWRHLAACFDFLHLEVIPPLATLDEYSTIVLTTPDGKQQNLHGRDEFAFTVGRFFLDRVRNRRLKAINDSNDLEPVERTDPDQPTVRVFFLSDMQEPGSLLRAATYAKWLKAWVEEMHGFQRFSRDERLHTVVVCMNAGISLQQDVLLQSFGQQPDTAIDTVLLLQQYSDDEAYIDGDAQIYQAELILYTLLLHWPQTFHRTIKDANEPLTLLMKEAVILPWPTYTLGTAAVEHSGRIAARWLDYGVAAKLLETLRNPEKVEQGEAIHKNIHHWLLAWWQEVQDTVPNAMISSVEELAVFPGLDSLLASASWLKRPSPSTVDALTAFSSQVSAMYMGTSGESLQQALEAAPTILGQFHRAYEQIGEEPASYQDQAHESYGQLAQLYTDIRRFMPTHFDKAEGALPRAIRQLSALTSSISEIRAVEQQSPDLAGCREDFRKQVLEAQKSLQARLKTWRLPFLGTFLRSTVISWLALLLGIILVVAVNWQTVLQHLPGSLSSLFPGIAEQPGLAALGIKVLLVVLLIVGEVLYLMSRNRLLRRERHRIHKTLSQTVRTHANQVRSVIAARVALALLQSADLYIAGENSSPYEQRLRDLDRRLKSVQQQAAKQQGLADKRLQLVIEEKRNRDPQQAGWPGLDSRQEILSWKQLEDAYLQSCQELTSNSTQLALIAEMLLRRLGTEAVTTILAYVLKKHHPNQNDNPDEHFQAVITMLVSLLLSFDIANPTINEVQPLLNHYVTLKNRSLPGPSVLGSDLLDLQDIVKASLVEQAMHGKSAARLGLRQTRSAELVLAAWVGYQRNGNPQMTSIFESKDVLDRLADRKLSVSQALEIVRGRTTLLGYPDEIAGDDYFSLLLPAGEISETFLRSLDHVQAARVHCEFFPDREKLVYFHIHRIHQLLAHVSSSTSKKPEQQNVKPNKGGSIL